LGFDRSDVAVVTNIAEGDHLGLGGITTVEGLARVKRVVPENVASTGSAVLKADDPLTAAMAAHCPGAVLFFARDSEHAVIKAHRAAGGRAVFVREKAIVLADGATEIPLLTLDRVPLTHGGRVAFQVENVLAATAATWALGVPAEVIRAGLESFSANLDKVPGRFNLREINGATVVFDYGHNPSSLVALLETLAQFPHERRTCIYSAAGDRRDEDLVRQGQLLGDAFDHVNLYEDQYTRGRAPGEIIEIFQRGLAQGRRVKSVRGYLGWAKALEEALAKLTPGELLMVQADAVDSAVEWVQQHLAATTREIGLKEALSPAPVPQTPRQ
jgi:cyanophycin synthetase